MKLVDDARSIWKRWSVWVQSAVAALGLYFLTLPDKIQDAVPHWILVAIGVAGALATIGLMPIQQKSLTKDPQ